MPPFLFPTGLAQICKDFRTKNGLRRKFVQEMRYFETKKKARSILPRAYIVQ